MNDLSKKVDANAQKMQDLFNALHSSTMSSIPVDSLTSWRYLSELYRQLNGTTPLFIARDTAWQMIDCIYKSSMPDKPMPFDVTNTIKYNGIDMEFSVARHLALTSYITITWSIYDRLANVCGRLISVSELANNPKLNPKVVEDFIDGKKTIPSTIQMHLKTSYEWPLKVSYKIRNWLVHEGYEIGNISLFKSSSLSDCFTLNDDAIEQLQKFVFPDNRKRPPEKDSPIIGSCILPEEESWFTYDLFQILKQYNNEIDIMFSALLDWSVSSFFDQVKFLAARHIDSIPKK